MFARPTPGLIALSAFVLAAPAPAQSIAPGGAPQGAPRHTSTAKVGEATLTVEHGQPPWSDDRLGAMAQIAQQGQPWRMGSEGITTFTVAGAPVFFGDELIEPGRYGFNLAPTGQNAWAFLVFEPLNEAQFPTMLGNEPSKTVAARFVGDAAEIVPAMTIDVAAESSTGTCTLAWGPMRLSADLAAAQVTRAELELNGVPAKSTWYRRALPAGADASRPRIAGSIELAIDDEDCSMNVYVMQEGDQVVALLRNREREQAEQAMALADTALKQFDALIQQFGAQAEAQVGPLKTQAQRQIVRSEITLEDSVCRPDQIRVAATGEAAEPGSLFCSIYQSRSSINLEVCVGGLKSVLRLDESLFALKGES